MTENQSSEPPKKKRTWCFCAGCLLIPVLTVFCLIGAYFIGPPLATMVGLIGPEADEVYALAPDIAAGEELNKIFTEKNIPGVRVYVIPIKDQPTQGAFIILDVSAGYQGLNPLDDTGDEFQLVLQEITRRNREQQLRLAHVTFEYRDQDGNSAFSFTVPQSLVEDYADGRITQEEFFSQVEIDLLNTIDYLDLDDYLEEIQP